MCLAHQSNRYRQEHIDWIAPFFRKGDHALTLTYPAYPNQYKPGFQPNYDAYNSHVTHYLQRIHRIFLGRSKKRLNCAYTHEMNYSNGLHTHMILEALPENRVPIHLHETILAETWAQMKHTGQLQGVMIKQVGDPAGWVDYMVKDLKTVDHARLSFNVGPWGLSPRP
jgi:hypothetical protein